VRVLVRTGDTKPGDRAGDDEAAAAHPGHDARVALPAADVAGRPLDAPTVRTVIVDEIHALVRDKRGAHLALSLERLEALTGRPFQRLGLSATQKPLEEVGAFLAGVGAHVPARGRGQLPRARPLVEVPPSPLATVCSHEQWEEIYARLAELVREHRTTLVFVNTRKMAERIAAQLTKILGEEAVTSHHGSLSKERRLDAEQRLKAGTLRALVATASLELGIDIGEVDLVVQVGATRSIATCSSAWAARALARPRPEGTDLPADARRARRGGDAAALHPRVAARPHGPAAAARSTSWRSRSWPSARPASGRRTRSSPP
jgi:ATP-dependent Lhr-like helicase